MRRYLLAGVMGVLILGLAGCESATIFQAAANGRLHKVEEYVQKDPQSVNAEHPSDKPTPLHYAATARQDKVAKYLLEHEADPLAKADGDWTPLHAARQSGDKTIEDMILKAIQALGRPMP